MPDASALPLVAIGPQSVLGPERSKGQKDDGLAQRVRIAFATMSQPHREALQLVYFMRVPLDASADALEISPVDLRIRLAESLRELSRSLA